MKHVPARAYKKINVTLAAMIAKSVADRAQPEQTLKMCRLMCRYRLSFSVASTLISQHRVNIEIGICRRRPRRLHQYPSAMVLFMHVQMNGICVTTPTDTPGVVVLSVSPKAQELYDLRASLAYAVLARRRHKHEQRILARAQATASV